MWTRQKHSTLKIINIGKNISHNIQIIIKHNITKNYYFSLQTLTFFSIFCYSRIRTQGLLSILGFGVLSLGFIKFVWTWVGFIMYSQHSLETICSDSFRDTFLSNFIVPLACLIPIGFTLVMFFAIKILNLLLSVLMPSTFVWISKRLWRCMLNRIHLTVFVMWLCILLRRAYLKESTTKESAFDFWIKLIEIN